MDRYTIFISDLHLSSNSLETTKLYIKLLEELSKEADALYILGDLFQFWVGDDDRSTFNEQIKEALKKASIKTPIYLMPGNRDFLLGQVFALESGCTLIPDPCEISLYGKKTLLTHGDILCTKDIKYRVFRNIIRIPYGIRMFLKLPLTTRLWFGNNIQKYSAENKSSKNKDVLAPQITDSKNLLNKFNSEQMIHGHIHVAESEELIMDTKKAWRISLGEWNKQGSILLYYDNHNFEFRSLIIK